MIDRPEPPLSTADLAGGGTTPRAPEPEVIDDHDHEPEGTPRMSDAASATRSSTTATQAADQTADGSTPLFPTSETEGFRSRWQEVQTGFVDEPRHAVEQADGLVAEMMQRLAKVFADERSKLEEQWSRGDDISTEDLRVAFRRYRSFFDRLLSV
jgi:hypothetical protein